MLKRSLRIKVIAATFSAAFLFGVSPADAYTYSGVTSTIDKIIEDDSDLKVDNHANITIKNIDYPHRIFITQNASPTNYDTLKGKDFIYLRVDEHSNDIFSRSSTLNYNNFLSIQHCDQNLNIKSSKMLKTGCASGSSGTIKNYFGFENILITGDVLSTQDLPYFYSQIEGINLVNTANGTMVSLDDCEHLPTLTFVLYDLSFKNIKNNGDQVWALIKEKYPNLYKNVCTSKIYMEDYYGDRYTTGGLSTHLIIFSDDSPFFSKTTEDASITVSNNSTLLSQGNVYTSKDINVTGTSKLTTATGTIIGGTISSDGDIIAQANYSAPSDKSTIAGTMISSTGTLTALKDIKATTGAISATVINTTSGNIVSNNFIKATGKVKGDAFNVGVINASSASITGNQSISGIFTTTGQAKLNGGAALGGKKITGLSIGTLSTTSTDAVNGKQLYTAMQSSGKTYTAGSDISISSANAISVSKAGKVASGDTGIMTGDAVYQETSKIDTVLKANSASITSNNSKLDSLTTSIESLRKSLGTINSSVSDAISGLPGSLSNFANKDLTDLSDTGINTLKNYIKSEIKKQMPANSKTASYAMEGSVSKDTSAIDTVIASKANASDLTALEKKVDGKADKSDISSLEDTINTKADLSYVNDGLAKKADQSVVEAVSSDVAKNTSAIAKNTELVQSNTEAISGLKDSKADSSGSNIDVSSWSDKLGTGTVAKDDTGLVTGSSVATALDKKAGIGYVAMGLGAMEGSLDQVNQSVAKDVSRVGAGASALMGLHPTGDKFEFATSYGHYKNSNNTALGVFYKPTTNSTVSVAGTIGDGDAMLSAGVSIKLGLNKEVKKVITPEEFGAMKTAVDSQDEKLDQMEKTLQQLMAK